MVGEGSGRDAVRRWAPVGRRVGVGGAGVGAVDPGAGAVDGVRVVGGPRRAGCVDCGPGRGGGRHRGRVVLRGGRRVRAGPRGGGGGHVGVAARAGLFVHRRGASRRAAAAGRRRGVRERGVDAVRSRPRHRRGGDPGGAVPVRDRRRGGPSGGAVVDGDVPGPGDRGGDARAPLQRRLRRRPLLCHRGHRQPSGVHGDAPASPR